MLLHLPTKGWAAVVYREDIMNTEKTLKIGKKTARLPLIQGGMGVGISLGGLAGAVAKEGGVGIISAAQIGFQEPDFDENPFVANLRAVHKELKRAREIADGGVVGFNIMVAMKNYESYVREVVEAGADIIISGAGLPESAGLCGRERHCHCTHCFHSEIRHCYSKILGQKV